MSKKSDAVTVCVRIRPQNAAEKAASMAVVMKATEDGKTIEEYDAEGEYPVKLHTYDHGFGDKADNQHIFDTVGAKLADAALEGYNTVLFMYGQTSSGKTFTLFGGGPVAGLVHLTMDYVYKKVLSHQTMEYVIRLQYAELYNEELSDLLSEKQEKLDIIDHPQLGPIIKNISEASCDSAEEIKELLLAGESRRHFGVTNMNAHSSRSHVIVRLTIEGKKVSTPSSNPLRKSWGKDKPTSISTLNLVDLAGSERVEKSGTSGTSLKEGAAINKSLLTLGNVINALTEGKNTKHINYRDSKLTRLLAAALGGNAKTLMITCVSPASGNLAESQGTLKFATRAKKIVNTVSKNETAESKSMAEKHKREIEKLKEQLMNNTANEEKEIELKEKAAGATKNVRRLKFLMLHAASVLKALRNSGATTDANSIQSDIHTAIAKGGDLQGVMQRIEEVSKEKLANSDAIMKKLEAVESDSIDEMPLDTIDAAEAGEGDAADDGEGGHRISMDMEDDIDGGVIWGDTQELTQQIEAANLSAEDLRGQALVRIGALCAEEKKQKKIIEDLHGNVKELHDQNQKHSQNVQRLEEELNETRARLEKNRIENEKLNEANTDKINELETIVEEKEGIIREKKTLVFNKDAEIERNKSQIESLNQELAAANAMREQLEVDFKKARHDMKTQMDKLRSNMHNLLSHQGDAAKALESQVTQMQQETDNLRDTIELLKNTKTRLETEGGHVRSDLQRFKDEAKSLVEENAVLKTQILDLTHQLQTQRLEITTATAKYGSSEKEIALLREQIKDNLKLTEIEKADAAAEHQEQLNSVQAQVHMLRGEVEILKVDKKSLLDDVERKQDAYNRLRDQLTNETSRLEKKLLAQIKTNEEVMTENAEMGARSHATVKSLREEIQACKEKIQERDNLLENIESFLSNNQGSVEDEVDDVIEVDDDYIAPIGASLRGVVPRSATLLKNAKDTTSMYNHVLGSLGLTGQDSNSVTSPTAVILSSSPQFLGIKQGLELVTKLLLFDIREEACIRNYFSSEQKRLLKCVVSAATALTRFKSDLDDSNENQEYIASELHKLHEEHEKWQDREEKLMERMRQLEKENLDIESDRNNCKSVITNLEDDKAGLKLLLEKSKADMAAIRENYDELKQHQNELSEHSEKCVEEMVAARREYGIIQQNYAVLEAERDELIEQFIKNPRSSISGTVSSLTAASVTNAVSSAYAAVGTSAKVSYSRRLSSAMNESSYLNTSKCYDSKSVFSPPLHNRSLSIKSLDMTPTAGLDDSSLSDGDAAANRSSVLLSTPVGTSTSKLAYS